MTHRPAQQQTRGTADDRRAAPRAPSAALLCLCAAALLLSTGCAANQTFDDPVAYMLNRSKGHDRRLVAVEQARLRFGDDPRRFEALHKLVWDRGHPATLRNIAIDHLLEIDEQDFVTKLGRRIVLVQNWDTLDYLFKLGVERDWPNFTAVVVRNYARTVPGVRDEDRRERQVLAQLHPDRPTDAVVFEVFARQDESIDVTQQVAAWELLNRISTTEQLLAHLAAAPDTTPLVIDLKAAARDLRTLPRSKEGVLRLQHLRDPARRAFWAAATARVAQLTPAQQRGLELRHMPALIALDQATLSMDRETLQADLMQRLEHAEHHLKSPKFDGGNDDHPQRLRQWRDKLAWADLATIHVLTDLLDDRAAAAALFDHAEKDHADTSTEYGGVIDVKSPSLSLEGEGRGEGDSPNSLSLEGEGRGEGAAPAFTNSSPTPTITTEGHHALHPPPAPPSREGGRNTPTRSFAVRRYTPMIRVHDLKFIPSQKMVEDMYTALAHYHFHAQEFKNSRYAGPGLGDLDFADRMEASCLVFTFIDRDRLNVDYYQPGRVVVDLGTLRR